MSSIPAAAADTALFKPIHVGDITLSHRVALAPLTRCRNTAEHVPTDLTLEHYVQRASTPGTLLITEATIVHPKAGGAAHSPGIYNEEQVRAWRKIVDAVHARDSFIFLQLWALGRAGDPALLTSEGNYPYVAPSPIGLSEESGHTPGGPAPRALTVPEIREYVTWYGEAAVRAVQDAGFDGVEIHGANGYLVDQFLQDVSNVRDDKYGGSVEGRCRFALEVVKEITGRIGEKRTALRCSPFSDYQDMGMKDPYPTFTYLVTQLRAAHPSLAYIHFIQPRVDGADDGTDFESNAGSGNDFVRKIWAPRPFVSAGGYDGKTARYVADRYGDIIAFGRHFIANPDLPRRIKDDLKYNRYDRSTFYSVLEPKGYTDYPFAEVDTAKGCIVTAV